MKQRVRVLYVDDDVQSLDLRARILENEYGFEVTTAENAEAGMRVLDNHAIDCILCDLKMPKIDGFEFFESIREKHPTVPFILFTAHESDEIVKDAYEIGMTDYFPKSALNISYDLLAHRIRQVVERPPESKGTATSTDRDADNSSRSIDEKNIEQSDFRWVRPFSTTSVNHVDERSSEAVSHQSPGQAAATATETKRAPMAAISEREDNPAKSTRFGTDPIERGTEYESANGGESAFTSGSADYSTEDESDSPPDPNPTDASSDTWMESSEYELPDDLDVEPGESVLVQCGSQDDRKQDACTDLMGLENNEEKNILLVRYKQVDEAFLERVANGADRVRVISIGYAQPVPQRLDDRIETIKINNPNDITRLGIVVTGTIEDWQTAEGETVVCYDPLDVLLRYKNVQSVFRFLHILLGKLSSADTTSHFHVDPSAEDPQEINTLKPLYDSVLSIDSMGIYLE